MRYIDINNINRHLADDRYQDWLATAQVHLQNIQNLDHAGRSAYFARNGDWSSLYDVLSALSFNKCWYSESPEGASEFEVDHYRPKNRSKQKDGTILSPDGYWWLAYEISNFRLTGSLVNRRRRDRFNASEEVLGKGDYFPLNLVDGQLIDANGDLDYELPYLLDPLVFHDTTLLGFDKDGKPIPTAEDGTFEYERAEISIDFLGLDHTPLNRQRKQVWENCENEIVEISKKIKNSIGGVLRSKILKDAHDKIRQLTAKTNAYSSVAISCVCTNSIEYPWLKPLIGHLG